MKIWKVIAWILALMLLFSCAAAETAADITAETVEAAEQITAETVEAAAETASETVEAAAEIAAQAVEAASGTTAEDIEAAAEEAAEAVEEAAEEAAKTVEEAAETAAEQVEETALKTTVEVIGEPDDEPEEEPAAENKPAQHLTVASMTHMTGDIFSEMYGNATSDIDMRYLIHGYNLVKYDGGVGLFNTDPSVVSGLTVTENPEGDRTYLLALYDDMVYSDGTKITAWDYAFSLLLQIQLRHMQTGIETDRRDYLLGYADYVRNSMPIRHTEFVAGDFGRTYEKVTHGRPSAGADLAEISELMKLGNTFTLNEIGELCPAEAGAEGAFQVHLNEEGIIQDWIYDGGVRVMADGSRAVLPGVRVLADDLLQISVDHEWLPFIHELGLLSCTPYPIHVIAPGVTVKDDGKGVYLANGDASAGAPAFTAELLDKTIFDEKDGYLYHAAVTSGAYHMVSFDGKTAEFQLNPLYKGDSEGKKPIIDSITFTLTDNEHAAEDLATGKIQLINKVTKADTIEKLLQLVQTGVFEKDGKTWRSPKTFSMSNYPRTGLSYISFRCERPGMDSQAVRQALAWCMDRDEITKQYTGGFGKRADSWYGIGQWMTLIANGEIAYPSVGSAEEWSALKLDKLTEYKVDTDQAASLLEADGWKLNAQGVREKDGQTLDLLLLYPEGNKIADSLQTCWIDNLNKIGVKLTLQPVEMAELLSRYYRQNNTPVSVGGAEREPDMIYLASNFELIFDPSWSFIHGEGGHTWAYTGHEDETLYQLALDMSRTEPGELLSYMKKWIAFEERFNETLPMIPIYSNVYFDFYTTELQGYTIDQTSTWSQAILGAELKTE